MFLSIVTVTFNDFSGVVSTLESILNIKSKFIPDIEWIVIDGGTNTDTKEYLQSEFTRLKLDKYRCKFIFESDKGIYDAMNKGINHSMGDYIIFMNSGDRFVSNSIEQFLTKACSRSVYYGNCVYNISGKDIFTFSSKMNKSIDFLDHNCFSHQAIFYPLHLLRKLNGYDLRYKISSDFDLTWRCFKTNISFINLNYTVANCELGGFSCQHGLQSYTDRMCIFFNSKSYFYALILFLYYPVFFIKNRIVFFLGDTKIFSFYRKIKFRK